jgi:hypothetical protein
MHDRILQEFGNKLGDKIFIYFYVGNLVTGCKKAYIHLCATEIHEPADRALDSSEDCRSNEDTVYKFFISGSVVGNVKP